MLKLRRVSGAKKVLRSDWPIYPVNAYYDFPTLVSILKNSGFEEIKRFGYQEGYDRELSSYDSRPIDSLHIEIIKK